MRSSTPIVRRALFQLRHTRLTLRRSNGTYQPPTPTPSGPNPHRTFWQSFGRPIAKVFLGALFTYQLAYLGWAKLESLEEEADGNSKITELEAKLHGLTKGKEKEGK
ncbi:hypothetical protein K461DRAFT_289477 [Myriangium duriaei CBS 260.36]|uniref:Uncharacterized protein n=1 Tax=Myriangium duriaei CBS 260.36 TaxID=1168546 RepID=A0A9P4MS30_9PEZI|nr:hypothetical protein K461DRAFT_289477 [Myriangium duriaei CBS 260.36]